MFSKSIPGRGNKLANANLNKLRLEQLESRLPMTVQFLFDYSLDANQFFNDPARRAALVQAGNFLANRFEDNLAAITPSDTNRWTPSVINPATGATVNIGRTSIPASTIVVYAGARNLPATTLGIGGGGGWSAAGTQAWFNTIKGRGQAGALAATPTDVAPWGGSITFDSVGVDWNFSSTTASLTNGKTDFVSVAMHELGHVMGLGLSGSWNRLVSGTTFIGAKAKAMNGAPVPLASDRAHFKDGLLSQKMEVAMDPTLTTGTRKLFSNLDYAALVDIGWTTKATDDSISRAQHMLTRRTADTNPIDSATISKAIESSGDVDIYRIYADAGTQLNVSSFTPSGRRAIDTYLRIFTSGGQQLAVGNQGGATGTDSATLKITRSDYYFVGISSFEGRTYKPNTPGTAPAGSIGDYRMTITLQNQAARSAGGLSASGEAASRADYFFANWLNNDASKSLENPPSKKKGVV